MKSYILVSSSKALQEIFLFLSFFFIFSFLINEMNADGTNAVIATSGRTINFVYRDYLIILCNYILILNDIPKI